VFGVDLVAPTWPFIALCIVWLLSVLTLVMRRTEYRNDKGPLRLLGFTAATVPTLIALLVATREVGGSHHLVVLWPYPLLMLVALLRVWLEPIRRLAGFAPMVLLLLVAGCVTAASGATYFQSLSYWRGDHGARPYFDPVLYEVAEALVHVDADRVISTGWGLHHGLLSLAPGPQRSRYLDWTWTLQDAPAKDAARTDWLWRTHMQESTVAWISWAPGLGLQDDQGHLQYLGDWKHCQRIRRTFPARSGEARVELYVLDLRASCQSSAPANR
jgi:hypothetical protein